MIYLMILYSLIAIIDPEKQVILEDFAFSEELAVSLYNAQLTCYCYLQELMPSLSNSRNLKPHDAIEFKLACNETFIVKVRFEYFEKRMECNLIRYRKFNKGDRIAFKMKLLRDFLRYESD